MNAHTKKKLSTHGELTDPFCCSCKSEAYLNLIQAEPNLNLFLWEDLVFLRTIISKQSELSN